MANYKVISAKYADEDCMFIDAKIINTKDSSTFYYTCNKTAIDSSELGNLMNEFLHSNGSIIDKYDGPSSRDIGIELLRHKRNKTLEATDKYMALDYPITNSQREEIKSYRQALRDITKQPGFPEHVEWPALPECIK